ncbi:MAG: ATPase, T2SS/T4P/T4SS family [Polyangiaceae bacterium]
MRIEVEIENPTGGRELRQFDAESAITIGRDADCSVRLTDDLVSRRHAAIRLLPEGIRIEDTSSNGTYADGSLLRQTAKVVPYGVPVLIGHSALYVRPERSISTSFTTVESKPSVLGVAASSGSDISAETAGAAERDLPEPTSPQVTTGGSDEFAELRREIHRQLLAHLDLSAIDLGRLDEPNFRPRVLVALRRIVDLHRDDLPATVDRDRLIGEMADEALGLGPLEALLLDPAISEIMVIDANTIYVERGGRIQRATCRFTDEDRVRAVIERIVTPLGRRIDESSPIVDARLPDGSRVNAIIRPLALRGSCITIRKFAREPLDLARLLEFGALSAAMGRFLRRSVIARKNVLISGGTGSGKTTLLNVLSAAIPPGERIVTIEDSAELRLPQPHVVSLETRPPNLEGKGEYTIRDLVKNALRMRPDRIVVGECRGGEALDMLQAMNTGHDGSLTTTHANSPEEALKRLETLVLMAGLDLPSSAIREQIASSIHLVVQQARLSDGSRKVTAISEITTLDELGNFRLRPIYRFVRTGTGARGEVLGHFAATGYLPSFLGEFMVRGLIAEGETVL